MKTICQLTPGRQHRYYDGFSAILFLFFLLLVSITEAQVNAYARVSAISGTTLTLSNANTSYHTFAAGAQVIIMQMQDNTIGSNTGNTATFGALSSIASAGLYEVATISSVTLTSGSPTSMVLSAALKRTYTIGTNSRVQVISFRNYGTNYTVSAAMTPLTWNGSIGGVLAIQVAGTLTLSASITADGNGFRGGDESDNYESSCEPTVYISNSSNYAGKGEGIYRNTNEDYDYGRGRILTGGGGGSDDNAGGGGGGNFTTGGEGGLGWTCTVATASGGLGGIPLNAYSTGTRIYMGGGGGGGQQNNSSGSAGGNGGGIILIKANVIATSCSGSVTISANGAIPDASGNDGAGGGGAGGTIMLQTGSYNIPTGCPLSLRSNGGSGGNVGNANAHGGGGGGGQGAIYSSAPLTAANVNAGTAPGVGGLNSSASGASSAGSGGGPANAGVIGAALTALPVVLTAFSGTKRDKEVLLNWNTVGAYQDQVFNVQRSSDGFGFTNIGVVRGPGNGVAGNYTFTDRSTVPGKRFYRVEMVDLSGSRDYSATVVINAGDAQAGALVVYPNPAHGQFFVQAGGSGSETYSLTMTDLAGNTVYNNTYSSVNNLLTVAPGKSLSPGTYLVKLTGRNNITKFGKIIIQ